MKQANLKLIDGGGQEPSPPNAKSASMRWWEATWTFGVCGIVWVVIGYWIWKYLHG